MQRRQGPIGKVPHQRSVNQVDVEVQHVELVDPAADLVQHDHVVRQRIAHRRIEAQRYVAAADEPGRCLGVAAGKQRDIVSLAHEFFSQKRNDAFRAAIKPGWHAFMKRGNLSDTHRQRHGTSLNKLVLAELARFDLAQVLLPTTDVDQNQYSDAVKGVSCTVGQSRSDGGV